jgi:hypothetical protein
MVWSRGTSRIRGFEVVVLMGCRLVVALRMLDWVPLSLLFRKLLVCSELSVLPCFLLEVVMSMVCYSVSVSRLWDRFSVNVILSAMVCHSLFVSFGLLVFFTSRSGERLVFAVASSAGVLELKRSRVSRIVVDGRLLGISSGILSSIKLHSHN